MTKYDYKKILWNGAIGASVRALLSLSNKSGAWLWFEHSFDHLEAGGIDWEKSVSVSQIVKAMLNSKLVEINNY